jgi:hypothetical protein
VGGAVHKKAIKVILLDLILILGTLVFISEAIASERTCSYDVAVWNVPAKKVIEVQRASHSYSELTEEEIDHETGCTVCSEDQVTVSLPSIADFRICRQIASEVSDALRKLIEGGVPILSIRGYQVVRSRGDIDENGNRTMLSNHSFGTAIDINREKNGLYGQCIKFGPECRLVLGGQWRPGTPGTLVENGPVVRAMKELGFKWGGEIQGRQKDFMHFSRTGY